MIKNIKDFTELNNGVKMPWLGLGVWQTEDGREVVSAVKAAVKAGYRHIDTAMIYGNEEGVGRAIKECGVAREELFITTKVWNSDQGYDRTLKAFEASRKKLGLEYVDLYLIHWPVKGKYTETWRALETIYKNGRARAIGLSNFHISHIEDILSGGSVVPAVDQVEFHPFLAHRELRDFCKKHKIQFEAWSPIMHGHLNLIDLSAICRKYGKTPAQVVLRWDLQHEVVTIPKSVHENRIIENSQIFDFELTADEMAYIDSLDRHQRFGGDPDNFDF